MKGWLLIIIGVVLIGISIYALTRKQSPASGTSSASTPPSAAPTPDPSVWVLAKTGAIQTDREWTHVGTHEGPVLIKASGCAFFGDGNCRSPAGNGMPAPAGFMAKGLSQFALIGRSEGVKPFLVGYGEEIRYVGERNLWLGPNEDSGVHGLGYADNAPSGWSYQVYVRR